ncbi:MAG: hypothetical protein R3F36_09815 [Candidatus Competibacteraceae bacterium]
MSAARYLGRILQGEGGFARAVGSGDDDPAGGHYMISVVEDGAAADSPAIIGGRGLER